MNTTFFYALILAVSNIVLSLVSFFLGYQTDKMAEGKWFGWLTMVLSLALAFVLTWLGVKSVREESADKSLRYGKGVGTGFLINLYSGVIGSITASSILPSSIQISPTTRSIRPSRMQRT